MQLSHFIPKSLLWLLWANTKRPEFPKFEIDSFLGEVFGSVAYGFGFAFVDGRPTTGQRGIVPEEDAKPLSKPAPGTEIALLRVVARYPKRWANLYRAYPKCAMGAGFHKGQTTSVCGRPA